MQSLNGWCKIGKKCSQILRNLERKPLGFVFLQQFWLNTLLWIECRSGDGFSKIVPPMVIRVKILDQINTTSVTRFVHLYQSCLGTLQANSGHAIEKKKLPKPLQRHGRPYGPLSSIFLYLVMGLRMGKSRCTRLVH